MIGANNRFVHLLLKVLICKNCYHFNTSGEFKKDEDGSELYCRWCGQGGQVLCCSSCEFVFCKRCIKNNFGVKKFKEIRNSDDWSCFRCHPEQLSSLRASCAEFMEYYRTELAYKMIRLFL
ncbi:transcriptional regulator ATRX-like isoform X2 [Dendroctonus ponderosae]|uniref:transcriptional regulator ATRX-like isoform X2 n=1 Tax=Dendroctonus ponderosae TaxID=77166 RepID=UPI002034CC88|nr:transcriptional regulator ATRX-like isoform X2 [Dendroctonus ponderosae]